MPRTGRNPADRRHAANSGCVRCGAVTWAQRRMVRLGHRHAGRRVAGTATARPLGRWGIWFARRPAAADTFDPAVATPRG